MFTISAEFHGKVEVSASFERVRDFIFDLQNFVEFMPNVESIHADARGVTRWAISVDIPVVGHVRQSFPVEQEETPPDELEWRPAAGEKENLLRYMAHLTGKKPDVTILQISQKVELRRAKAKDLHTLAAIAGEKLISKEMNKRVGEMITEFLNRAKAKLES
jgi:carbon monoxide dehydrogenase subunit G